MGCLQPPDAVPYHGGVAAGAPGTGMAASFTGKRGAAICMWDSEWNSSMYSVLGGWVAIFLSWAYRRTKHAWLIGIDPDPSKHLTHQAAPLPPRRPALTEGL